LPTLRFQWLFLPLPYPLLFSYNLSLQSVYGLRLILFSVSVPVLSVQMIVALPKLSTVLIFWLRLLHQSPWS
jgi:hypothetical protein